MKQSYQQNDTVFISCLVLKWVECFCEFLDGTWDVNYLIWMTYFGTGSPFLEAMKHLDMKTQPQSHMRWKNLTNWLDKVISPDCSGDIKKSYWGHTTELFLDNFGNQELDNLRDYNTLIGSPRLKYVIFPK